MSSEAPTAGFRLTHVGLRIADIDRSVAFYSAVFGMSELGRMALDTVTVVFLGYSDSPGAKSQLFAREGVLELVCPKDQSRTMANSSGYPDFRYVKLAIAVPDMEKAMDFIKSRNVKVLKDAGVAANSEVVATFLGCETPEKGFDGSLWEAVVTVPFIEDPDGYLIEIIPY